MSANKNTATELIVALDVDTVEDAIELVNALGATVSWYKVGKQFFTRYGPDTVRMLKERGKKVFLDLKYHDIPNTAAAAVRAAAAIGADLTNVHAGGGPAMLIAAARAAAESSVTLVAVTVLTSMNATELNAVGLSPDPQAQVLRLAELSKSCGVSGVVCSALEITAIREVCGPDFVLVAPGIRLRYSDHGDQKRVMTPGEAAAAGADYIVVGRPIRHAPDPAEAARAIRAELMPPE